MADGTTDDGAPAPLVFRERFFSSDLVEVEEFIRTTYTDISLRHTGAEDQFGCRHDTIGAAGLAIGRMQTWLGYGGRVEPMDGLLTVVCVQDGSLAWDATRYGPSRWGPGDVALTPPLDAFSCVNDHADLAVTTLDGVAVADHAAHSIGVAGEDVYVIGLTPISASTARYWNATVAHVRDAVLGNPVAAASPILVDNAFRTLAAAFLSTFPNTALAAATDPDRPGVRGDVPAARLREVVEHLDVHAHRPVGPAEIAAVGGAPVREVVEGLRRRRDTHPAQLLWRSRLAGAHRELRDTDPTATAATEPTAAVVAAVAARWGFEHFRRFRIAYLKAFGELPEDTLQR